MHRVGGRGGLDRAGAFFALVHLHGGGPEPQTHTASTADMSQVVLLSLDLHIEFMLKLRASRDADGGKNSSSIEHG